MIVSSMSSFERLAGRLLQVRPSQELRPRGWVCSDKLGASLSRLFADFTLAHGASHPFAFRSHVHQQDIFMFTFVKPFFSALDAEDTPSCSLPRFALSLFTMRNRGLLCVMSCKAKRRASCTIRPNYDRVHGRQANNLGPSSKLSTASYQRSLSPCIR